MLQPSRLLRGHSQLARPDTRPQAAERSRELAQEAHQPKPPVFDQFEPSAELADDQAVGQVDPANSDLKPDQRVTEAGGVGARTPGLSNVEDHEVKDHTQDRFRDTSRQSAIRPQTRSDRSNEAGLMGAPAVARPATAVNTVKQTGTSQSHMGERRRPRIMDRASYLERLKSTFGADSAWAASQPAAAQPKAATG